MLKPNFKFNRVTDLTLEFLNSQNVNALFLDVDNTLSTHHGEELVSGLTEWIKVMESGNIKLMVLSNGKKKRVKKFCEKINLPFVAPSLKPLPFGFLKAIKKVKENKKNVALVGDQIFTDVLGGNFVGVKTILLTPILPENGISFKIRRKLESKLLKNFEM